MRSGLLQPGRELPRQDVPVCRSEVDDLDVGAPLEGVGERIALRVDRGDDVDLGDEQRLDRVPERRARQVPSAPARR